MPPTFDLQSHSIHSDGALPAAEVVTRAKDAGVELLALSDHDTVDGVEEALQTAKRIGGITNVPAGEISSVPAEYEDLHVLGDGVDHTDPHLLEQLAAFRQDRETRADRMAEALQELGWEIDDAPLKQRREQGKTIGRPHLAKAAFDHPANADRVKEEDLQDFSALLVAYLIPGAPAFRRRTHPTVTDEITLIHEAGGTAIWAHPYWDLATDDEVLQTIDRFRQDGLDGVEVFYVTHTPHQVLTLADYCEANGLLTTGSSDFHGPEHRHFAHFRRHHLHGRTPRLGPIDSR